MGDLIHHLVHFLIYSLIIWQIVLGVYIILLWTKRNIKFEKTSPVINVSETKGFDYPIEVLKDRLEGKKVGPTGPVEVGVDRNVFIDKADKTKIKIDEVKKGKVKTQR